MHVLHLLCYFHYLSLLYKFENKQIESFGFINFNKYEIRPKVSEVMTKK